MMERNHASLSEAYLYATEVNLATLDELCSLANSSGSRIKRQMTICLGMLTVCQSDMVAKTPAVWGPPHHPNFARVQRLLESADKEEGGLSGFLARHVATFAAYRR